MGRMFSRVGSVFRFPMWKCNSPDYRSCYYVIMSNHTTHVVITNPQSHPPQPMCDSICHAQVTAAP